MLLRPGLRIVNNNKVYISIVMSTLLMKEAFPNLNQSFYSEEGSYIVKALVTSPTEDSGDWISLDVDINSFNSITEDEKLKFKTINKEEGLCQGIFKFTPGLKIEIEEGFKIPKEDNFLLVLYTNNAH